ncbi:MAG TPA: hypothetical protein PLE62_09445 [Sphingorhabdus sp.]|uniref:hypothetical protein n=1 Tax=Sphingorhabdus sp. TaxID=1902408 RepID=UPI0026CA01A0|nr:hypothetical protein [Sphingorhabdus sp.]HQS13269.1 hypothetical protein [Sphingorhabdus sp.]
MTKVGVYPPLGRDAPSPIAREQTAPPKPEAAPMYLAQSHKGTKKGQPDLSLS